MGKKIRRRKPLAKQKMFKAVTLLLTCLICSTICLVAILIRSRLPLYVQEPGHELTGHRYLYDQLYGWKNIPGWQSSTINQPLSINSKGLRDREYPYQKPAGTKRILVLGDSYTWGYGVGNKEIYTEVLEQTLQDKYPHYEVLNAGVSGWGTDQQYLFLITEGLKYSPDLVIVSHFINDLDEILQTESYGLQKPIYRLQGNNLVPGNLPVPRPSLANTKHVQRINPFLLTKHLLEEMQQKCSETNCPLVVMQFGTFIFPDRDDSIKLRKLITSAFPLMKNIHYLDLDGAFSAAELSAEELIGKNKDHHWDANGHRQTAEILYRFLQEQQLLSVR